MPSGKDILFFSDSLFDIDIGVINVVKERYNNPKFIDTSVLYNDPLFFKEYILEYCTTNVLDSVLLEEAKSSSQSLYDSIIEKHYDRVIELSPMTDIISLVVVHKNAEMNTNIAPVILCRSQIEVDKIKAINVNIETILVKNDEDLKEFPLNRFTRILMRNISTINKLKQDDLKGKSLVVLSYRFNFEVNNSIKLLGKYTTVSEINNFESIVPYSEYESPEG